MLSRPALVAMSSNIDSDDGNGNDAKRDAQWHGRHGNGNDAKRNGDDDLHMWLAME